MKKLLLLFMVSFLFACKQDVTTDPIIFPQEIICFVLQDKEGNDLLDPKSPNAIDTSAIKLKYMDNTGKWSKSEKPNYIIRKTKSPNYILPDYVGDNFAIMLLVRDKMIPSGNPASTMCIMWDESKVDTLQCFLSSNYGEPMVSGVMIENQSWQVRLGEVPYFKKLISNGKSEITMY